MAKIPKRAEFGLLKMKFLEMLAISGLLFILGISFILAACFFVEALCYG